MQHSLSQASSMVTDAHGTEFRPVVRSGKADPSTRTNAGQPRKAVFPQTLYSEASRAPSLPFASDSQRPTKAKPALTSTPSAAARMTTRKHISQTLLKKSKKMSESAQKAYQYLQKEKERATKLFLTESSGYLEAEGMEKTYRFTQEDIKEHLDLVNRSKIFDLNLNTFGPYLLNYTRNGRHLLIGGHKGHLANFDWKRGQLFSEFHVRESIRDLCWLHNETLFAAAQKEYVYIYDRTGLELHVLRGSEAEVLLYFPSGDGGILRYHDVSTGQLAAEHSTRKGSTQVMALNPANAIVHCGHANGTVTLWCPSVAKPLVQVLCHRGAVSACAVHGPYMVTAGVDRRVAVWDLRQQAAPVWQRRTPTVSACLAVSQRGLLATTHDRDVVVYPQLGVHAPRPYMHARLPGAIHACAFVPFDDVLGVGHSQGVSSLVIPGSGEPNLDGIEANPYETRHMRREREVHQLLEKLPMDTISLDPDLIGQCTQVAFRDYYHGNGPSTMPAQKKESRRSSLKKEKGKRKSQDTTVVLPQSDDPEDSVEE